MRVYDQNAMTNSGAGGSGGAGSDLRAVSNAGEALILCEDLVRRQLSEAELQKPAANVPIAGDSDARQAILLLLSDQQRRRLFVETANKMENWARIRPLFGAPPYSFLHPNDAMALRAGGFANGRANMAYETLRAANSSQFGTGQFEDEFTREYRIVTQQDDAGAGLGMDFIDSAPQLVLQVKIKKTSPAKKRELLRTEFKKQLFFPQPGETVQLTETKQLVRAMGESRPRQTLLRVRALYPRSQGSSTATIVLAR